MFAAESVNVVKASSTAPAASVIATRNGVHMEAEVDGEDMDTDDDGITIGGPGPTSAIQQRMKGGEGSELPEHALAQVHIRRGTCLYCLKPVRPRCADPP